MATTDPTVDFIGLGVMGAPTVRSLFAADLDRLGCEAHADPRSAGSL